MSRPPRRSLFSRLLRTGLWLAAALIAVALAANIWLMRRCSDRIQTDPASAPVHQAALVLGTGKFKADGSPNGHFTIRMDAAAALWKAGRVKVLILSGDNGSDPKNYNEPADMREALLERGVRGDTIVLDGAGLRTLDSVVRAKEVFGLKDCLIVTDDFHLPRALWLADCHDLKADGFAGRSLDWSVSWKGRSREWLARLNGLVETGILHRRPDYKDERRSLPR